MDWHLDLQNRMPMDLGMVIPMKIPRDSSTVMPKDSPKLTETGLDSPRVRYWDSMMLKVKEKDFRSG